VYVYECFCPLMSLTYSSPRSVLVQYSRQSAVVQVLQPVDGHGCKTFHRRRSARNRSASNVLEKRVLTSTCRRAGRGSGSWNSTSEWSEYSPFGQTVIAGGGRSARVTSTSSVWPSLCVGPVTNCRSPNVSMVSWNRRLGG